MCVHQIEQCQRGKEILHRLEEAIHEGMQDHKPWRLKDRGRTSQTEQDGVDVVQHIQKEQEIDPYYDYRLLQRELFSPLLFVSLYKVHIAIEEEGIHKGLHYDLAPELNLVGCCDLFFIVFVPLLILEVIYYRQKDCLEAVQTHDEPLDHGVKP